jgi:hypothetical protein
MGYGSYSIDAHRAITAARSTLSQGAVFSGRSTDPAMNPHGVRFRQSRDSSVHPNSTGIVFALDVSGSMGEIPHQLATRTLPTFMESVLAVLPDPQVLFIAFGNAYSDRSPLQVGQFESEAALIDRWLSACHLEGAGGTLGESYDLAMYFAARHTQMDCLQQRRRKGYFFMTGDEVPFVHVHPPQVQAVLGDTLEAPIPIHELTTELLRSFYTFFLIPDRERAGRYQCEATWRRLLHERVVVLETPQDTALVCAMLVGIQEGRLPDVAAVRVLLETQKLPPEVRERVVAAVTPFAHALARGPIADPLPLGTQPDPGVGG